MNQTGGPSSYVELLSCLEVMTDAKTIFKNDLLLDAEHHTFELNTRAANEDNLFTVDSPKSAARTQKKSSGVTRSRALNGRRTQ